MVVVTSITASPSSGDSCYGATPLPRVSKGYRALSCVHMRRRRWPEISFFCGFLPQQKYYHELEELPLSTSTPEIKVAQVSTLIIFVYAAPVAVVAVVT